MTCANIDEQQGVEWTFVDHGEKLLCVVMTQALMWPSGSFAKYSESLKTDAERFVYSAEMMKSALEDTETFRTILSSAEPEVFGQVL